MGPLISEKQRNRVESYIDIGTKEGARLACGGSRPTHLNRGWYIEPTVFADVDNEMRIAQEEIFGPVVCVIPYENMDEAVRLANASSYGLGGAVFTSDEQAGLAVARRIRTGTVAINTYGHTVSSPFGGMKLSGLGREHGREGIEEYLEYKAINIPSALAEAFETRRTAPDMNPLK
jgi:acyl-CoA reductase-like NAD-dependent aldehyde dehydrogenase